VTIGGPGDGIIEPWQSAHFENYEISNDAKLQKVEDFDFYKNNIFGLRELDESGKWIKITQNGIGHSQWVRNAEIIQKFILPNLS